MQEFKIIDDDGNWIDEGEQPQYTISRTLKNAFGENFEQASIHQKLFLLKACCESMRLDINWQEAAATWDSDIDNLDFPEFFEDTQEAMKLIQDLNRATLNDMTFHNLPIGGLC